MKSRDFLPIYRFISKTIQGMSTVTIEDEWEFLCYLLSSVISTNTEWLSTYISRSLCFPTSNVSKIVQDRLIFDNGRLMVGRMDLLNSAIFNDFNDCWLRFCGTLLSDL